MINNISQSFDLVKENIVYPDKYLPYVKGFLDDIDKLHKKAVAARTLGYDPTLDVESGLAFDLADRVEGLLGLPIAKRLRELLKENRTEFAALEIAKEVALGRFSFQDKETLLNLGIRAGLAVITDGVTVAPLQGVSSVSIRTNDDGTTYASISFAGPIRSAGGTEAAFTLVIADRLRIALGLDRYQPTDDEVGRYIEELRLYEREVSNFQYRISDEDIKLVIKNLAVEINGVDTDPVEVVSYRGLKRVSTDRVRGGALRVLNDGVIGRSRKLWNLITDLSIPNWEWLNQVNSYQKSVKDKTDKSQFNEIIAGRPVLCFPERAGGLRLRYGRGINTGLSTVGIHPATSAILDWPVVPGTQIKLDIPGKGATVAWVDNIESPIVRLYNGSVIRVNSISHANEIKSEIQSVLHMGDILINFGDFLENNVELRPSGYVEEWWIQEVISSIQDKKLNFDDMSKILKVNFTDTNQLLAKVFEIDFTAEEAWNISEKLNVPLHPKHLLFWDYVTPKEVEILHNHLYKKYDSNTKLISCKNDSLIKKILEKICAEHKVDNELIILENDIAYTIFRTLCLDKTISEFSGYNNIIEYLTSICGINIKQKNSTRIGVRVGRPEKSMMRLMRPSVHSLFPIGENGGITRDIYKASEDKFVRVEIQNSRCSNCDSVMIQHNCQICGSERLIEKKCPNCGRPIENIHCSDCKTIGVQYSTVTFPLKESFRRAFSTLQIKAKPPYKGVKYLMNPTKVPEILEKGILRKEYDLSVYKDGTIRFDVTNAPLTHFTPSQINTSISKLHKLGYTHDKDGKPLVSEDQTLELFVQDVILPEESSTCLVNGTKYIDDLLQKLYKLEGEYFLSSKDDLIGQLIMGLAPHTSVGIVGRIIGFTPSKVCLAHPYWHSSKRRDCDGDEDAIILLLDVFLNFSKEFLPAQIGGFMDAPLMTQILVIPKEVQRQAQNIDYIKYYHKTFYENTQESPLPQTISQIMDIAKDRLGKKEQFSEFNFTHDTSILYTKHVKSNYTTLKTTNEKIDKQIELATKINAVEPSEVVMAVLNTHLIPDIIGNLSAFTSQNFKCKKCNFKYRRIPLKEVCLKCGGDLRQTVTRGSVEKYLSLASNLVNGYEVDDYLKNKLDILKEELNSVFNEKVTEIQVDLNKFIPKR